MQIMMMRSLSLLLITSSSLVGLAAGADLTTYTNTGSASRDDRMVHINADEPVVSPEGCLLESIMSNWQSDRRVEYCFDLRNDDEGVVGGKFCVMGRIETELKVRVEAAEGYRLLKNHIWVGDDLKNVPLKSNGDVDILKFPEQGCDSNAEVTSAMWTIHENHNPCERNVATKDFFALGQMSVQHMETGKTTTVYPTEHDANEASPLPWVDVTLWCGCDGFYVRRRNLRGSASAVATSPDDRRQLGDDGDEEEEEEPSPDPEAEGDMDYFEEMGAIMEEKTMGALGGGDGGDGDRAPAGDEEVGGTSPEEEDPCADLGLNDKRTAEDFDLCGENED